MTKKKFGIYHNLDPYRHPSNIFFLRYCKYKIEVEKKNIIIAIVGKSGSGKSYGGISFAELLNLCGIGSNFNVDRVHFRAKNFLAQINEKDDKGKFFLKAGDCNMLDEAGIEISSREWFSEVNKRVMNVLETFRWRGLVTILTVPDLSFIDVKARKLLTMIFEVKHILKQQQISIVKPLLVSVNQRDGKVYYIYYKYRNPTDRRIYKITNLFFPIPSLELRNAYEKKKQEFATRLAEAMQQEIEWVDIKKSLNPLQRKMFNIMQREEDIGYKKLGDVLAISEDSSYKNLKYIYYILGKEYKEEPPILKEVEKQTDTKVKKGKYGKKYRSIGK